MARTLRAFLGASLVTLSACSPDVGSVFETSSNQTNGGGGTAGAGAQGGGGGTGGSGAQTASGGGTSSSTSGSTTSSSASTSTTLPCGQDPNQDSDGDGFTPAEGDCNDCDAAVNPGAVEIVDEPGDENCNGQAGEALPVCDDTVSIDNPFAIEVARAVELCKVSNGPKDWGVVSADWVLPDGSAPPTGGLGQQFHLGHGVLPDFGPNVTPHGGKRVLVLSNGMARRPNDPGFQDLSGVKGYDHSPAPGFPKETLSCPGVVSGSASDGTALSVKIRVPTNAKGFKYEFVFYSYDFPAFVCDQYNDVFFTLLSPTTPGQPDDNIAFDDMGNPVTLNAANFRVCGCMNGPPCVAGGKTFSCPLGINMLQGNGFDGAGSGPRGATGWLVNSAPVEAGSEITIRWGIYDAGDQAVTSTAVVDNWQWITHEGTVIDTTLDPG